jgi:hypothetical protein
MATKTAIEDNENGYLDVGDNVHANVNEWLQTNCGDNSQWFIPGVCGNGHRIAKIIVCGKEWCPLCGTMGSMAHNRRYVRWLPKIMQFQRMDYLVFTIPENIRSQYRDKVSLRDAGRACQKLLKSLGYNRGMRRWHWFGDKSTKWNPHLNVLVEGGYIKADKLAAIKRGWAKILGVDVIDVSNSYKRTPADMAGCLHYVTRATFLDFEYDIEMAQELRGFRNMVVWGKNKWDNEPVWELNAIERKAVEGEDLNIDAIEHIIEHSCPKCGSHITWDKALPGKLLDILDKESYGAGYYGIIDRSPPKQLSTDMETRLSILRMEWLGKCMLSEYGKKRVETSWYGIIDRI